MPKRIHKKYSVELKLKAVNDYLSGKGTQWEICKKYEILSTKQLSCRFSMTAAFGIRNVQK